MESISLENYPFLDPTERKPAFLDNFYKIDKFFSLCRKAKKVESL